MLHSLTFLPSSLYLTFSSLSMVSFLWHRIRVQIVDSVTECKCSIFLDPNCRTLTSLTFPYALDGIVVCTAATGWAPVKVGKNVVHYVPTMSYNDRERASRVKELPVN